METEQLIKLPASSNSDIGGEKVNLHDPDSEISEAESEPRKFESKGDKLHEEVLESGVGEAEVEVTQHLQQAATSTLQVTVDVTETVAETEMIDCAPPTVRVENGNPKLQEKSSPSNLKTDAISGVKRPRITFEGHQTSVHVIYNSLTSYSKRKLEELLQQWSEWHTQHCSSCSDSSGALESGEETYFPALQVGLDKPSAVPYWVDNQAHNPQHKEFVPLDGKSVPVYDRGYSLALTSGDGSNNHERALGIVDAPRCFNCNSYSHSLKECPKPRDTAAVNSARKQHNSKRNHNPSSRNPSRYYQNSPGGKFEGLRPGALDAETRKLLGLGEFDPPPWLNRMREIGYPPGYLDPEADIQPSGITIFSDEEIKETEDGEILDTAYPEPSRTMSAKFPGINAPIPENADERRWADVSLSLDAYRSRSLYRLDSLPERTSRGYYHEKRYGYDDREDRPPDTYDDRDKGPPGVDPQTYRERYGVYNPQFTYSSRGSFSLSRSPNYGRHMSDRGWRSPFSP